MTDITPTTDVWRAAPPAGSSDVIFGDLVAPPRRRGWRGIAATLAVFVLITGGGVYALGQLSGGGAQPESRAPASTFAFIKVDLDPALGQKLAFRSFASNFPDAPNSDAEDIFEVFVAEALRTEQVDYDRDVRPWFDKRIALVGFVDAAGAPQALGIIKVTDENSARVGLEKLAAADGSQFAFRVSDGFAVIADTHAIADSAIQAASERSLADNEQYGSDVARLGGDQVVTAWVDLGQVATLMQSAVPMPLPLPMPLDFNEQLRGRLVGGLHFAGDYAEIEGYAFGTTGSDQLTAASPSLLTALPASTVGAVAMNGLDTQLGSLYSDMAAAGLDPDEMLAFVEEETGLSVLDDMLPLIGGRTVIALGSVPGAGGSPIPRMALISEVDNPDRAREAGQKIVALASKLDIPARSEVRDTTFYLASDPTYLDELTSGDGLGEDAMFRRAMGDLGDDVTGAVYVDLRPLVAAFADDDPNLGALRAVGMSSTSNDDGDYFRLRLVVG